MTRNEARYFFALMLAFAITLIGDRLVNAKRADADRAWYNYLTMIEKENSRLRKIIEDRDVEAPASPSRLDI